MTIYKSEITGITWSTDSLLEWAESTYHDAEVNVRRYERPNDIEERLVRLLRLTPCEKA